MHVENGKEFIKANKWHCTGLLLAVAYQNELKAK